MPGPRKLCARGAVGLVEGGLEDERDPSRAVISFSRPAISCVQRSALDHAGPGDQEQRLDRARPRSPASFMRSRRLRQLRGAVRARGADEAGEQRMAVARRGGELRVELGRHEPGVVRAAR